MILKLALRNALRHGKSTLLILFFMTAVGMVFMVGNSLLVTVNRSMKEGFRNHITSDAVILSETPESMSLFGATIPSIGEFFSLPVLKSKTELEALLAQSPFVESYTPLISGNSFMEAQDYRRGVPFFGIDGNSYFTLFSQETILEGEGNFEGPGALIPRSLAMEWKEKRGKPLRVGDLIKFSTLGDIGFTIRSIPIKAIYEYPYHNPLIDPLVLMDNGTARDLVRVLADQTKDSSPEEASDLLNLDMDSLFEMEGADKESTLESDDILSSLDSLFDEPLPLTETEEGSWHFLLVRFTPKSPYGASLRKLSNLTSDYPVQVLNWRQAAGTTASYGFFIQLFFYGGFILIMLAGVLGIVNIMLISLFQRTVEIGTIQTLGATTGFVNRLLSTEYFLVSLAGGGISLVLSRLLFSALNSQQIILGNSLLNLVFGGKPLYFPFSISLAAVTLFLCLFTGWLSALYPVRKALALEPVDALKGGHYE